MRSCLLQSKLYGNSNWKVTVTPKTSQTATVGMSVQAWSYCHAHKSWGDIMVRALNSLILSSPTYERGNSSSRVPLKRIWYASSLQGISPFPNQPDLLGQKLDVCYNLPSNYPCRWMLLCLSPAVWDSSKMPTLMDWRSHSSNSQMVAHSNLCRIPIRNTKKILLRFMFGKISKLPTLTDTSSQLLDT